MFDKELRAKLRGISGLNVPELQQNTEQWLHLAREYKDVALTTASNCATNTALPAPYFLNAALSFELLLKALMVAQSKSIKTTHDLPKLAKACQLKLSDDQLAGLSFLASQLVWAARYPTPKSDEALNTYLDEVMDNVVSRQVIQKGNTSERFTRPHPKRFPFPHNYLVIWELIEERMIHFLGKQTS